MSDRSTPETSREGWDVSREITLFEPRDHAHAQARGDRAGATTTSLPPDLRQQATRRLRLIALTYALAFLLADLVPTALLGDLPARLTAPIHWVPSVASIVMGLLVAGIAANTRISWERRVNLGLLFEVLASYGIAIAQYHMLPVMDANRSMLHSLSPSWVGIWLVFFSIAVPAPPRRAVVAALASASAAPVVIAFAIDQAHLWGLLTPASFFFAHVFPYLVCVLLGYIGARVVYNLGKDVTRARELGSYQLEQRLGTGGMGEVWRASHRLLARPAAIKFIRPESIAGAHGEEARLMLKRFEREARATASLSSAHTVSLYDYGVTEGGVFYYVMELLDGFDFDHLVRRFGPLPPARLVHLIVQACESLEEAHRSGLIHRDVKPANLYLCRSGARCDFVKVLDFGLVAHSASAGDAESRLTLPQHAAGTPAYMPPEIAGGRQVDGRADLYALGCVAYWLATGKPVFTGNNAYEIVSQHLHATPEPPSRRGGADVTPELEAAILRCLAKSPDDRPANAREMARLFSRVPVADRWTDDEAEAWWNAHQPSTPSAAASEAETTPLTV